MAAARARSRGVPSNTIEPHARGAILVAAVFDAFLGIYDTRTADLLRLATRRHRRAAARRACIPDLVGRLAAEAAKAAQHVLTMCIRALDYCPPVDITFGEFLRAVITADTDPVPDDDLHYRIAFVEAFRRRGIYPRDLRTLSPDSLLWRTPESDEIRPSQTLQDALQRLQPYASEFLFAQQRRHHRAARAGLPPAARAAARSARVAQRAFRDARRRLERRARSSASIRSAGFEVHTRAVRAAAETGRRHRHAGADRHHAGDRDPSDPAMPGSPSMPFEGGCTLVGDLRRLKIRYCIRKNVESTTRQARQQVVRGAV